MSNSLSEIFSRLSLVRLLDSLSTVSANRDKAATTGQVVKTIPQQTKMIISVT